VRPPVRGATIGPQFVLNPNYPNYIQLGVNLSSFTKGSTSVDQQVKRIYELVLRTSAITCISANFSSYLTSEDLESWPQVKKRDANLVFLGSS